MVSPASEPQNCDFPCKIPCYQGIRVETGAIGTASPANQSGAWKFYTQKSQKCPPMAGFCELAVGLRAPKLAAVGAKSPKVSGGYLKYSCFRETATGDRFRSTLLGGRGSAIRR